MKRTVRASRFRPDRRVVDDLEVAHPQGRRRHVAPSTTASSTTSRTRVLYNCYWQDGRHRQRILVEIWGKVTGDSVESGRVFCMAEVKGATGGIQTGNRGQIQLHLRGQLLHLSSLFVFYFRIENKGMLTTSRLFLPFLFFAELSAADSTGDRKRAGETRSRRWKRLPRPLIDISNGSIVDRIGFA